MIASGAVGLNGWEFVVWPSRERLERFGIAQVACGHWTSSDFVTELRQPWRRPPMRQAPSEKRGRTFHKGDHLARDNSLTGESRLHLSLIHWPLFVTLMPGIIYCNDIVFVFKFLTLLSFILISNLFILLFIVV